MRLFCGKRWKMSDLERMLSGKLYHPYKVKDNIREKNRETLEKFNNLIKKQYIILL